MKPNRAHKLVVLAIISTVIALAIVLKLFIKNQRQREKHDTELHE